MAPSRVSSARSVGSAAAFRRQRPVRTGCPAGGVEAFRRQYAGDLRDFPELSAVRIRTEPALAISALRAANAAQYDAANEQMHPKLEYEPGRSDERATRGGRIGTLMAHQFKIKNKMTQRDNTLFGDLHRGDDHGDL